MLKRIKLQITKESRSTASATAASARAFRIKYFLERITTSSLLIFSKMMSLMLFAPGGWLSFIRCIHFLICSPERIFCSFQPYAHSAGRDLQDIAYFLVGQLLQVIEDKHLSILRRYLLKAFFDHRPYLFLLPLVLGGIFVGHMGKKRVEVQEHERVAIIFL